MVDIPAYTLRAAPGIAYKFKGLANAIVKVVCEECLRTSLSGSRLASYLKLDAPRHAWSSGKVTSLQLPGVVSGGQARAKLADAKRPHFKFLL